MDFRYICLPVKEYVRFEILSVVTVTKFALWPMTPCHIVWGELPDPEYGDTAFLRNTNYLPVDTVQHLRQHESYQYRCENLKSLIFFSVFLSDALSYKDGTTSMSDECMERWRNDTVRRKPT